MPRDEFGHLEHADLLLATKDRLQRVIGVDQSPLFLVLEIGGGSSFANNLDFIGDRRECPELYLLLWRLSVCLNL
jgi:hypothetical protein